MEIMTNFRRLNVNSELHIYTVGDFFYGNECVLYSLEFKKEWVILQWQMIDPDHILVEALHCQTVDTSNANKGDIDFENYLDTVINKDPFGAKYSGKKIREVFESGDAVWLERALAELRNNFLRDRLQYIVDRGGYGKIQC